MLNNSMVWILLFFIFTFLEILAPNLISIWFSISSLVVFVLSYFIIKTEIQILIFSIIALILIISIKPLFKKYTNKNKELNGIGDEVKILKIEDEKYVVGYKGVHWNAISENNEKYEIGKVVKIKGFKGNNIII